MMDRFGLERFVAAQAGSIDRVRAELAGGRKQSHWMWFVFPQIAGLGSSGMARCYAISGLPEARAYLAHPLLGARLREFSGIVLAAAHNDAARIFGPVDAMKFCSCMTLFQLAENDENLFSAALEKFFGGRKDARTIEILMSASELPAGALN